jgi:hypothetical protein
MLRHYHDDGDLNPYRRSDWIVCVDVVDTDLFLSRRRNRGRESSTSSSSWSTVVRTFRLLQWLRMWCSTVVLRVLANAVG